MHTPKLSRPLAVPHSFHCTRCAVSLAVYPAWLISAPHAQARMQVTLLRSHAAHSAGMRAALKRLELNVYAVACDALREAGAK